MSEKKVSSNVWLSPLVGDKHFHAQFRGDHVHVEIAPEFKVDPRQQSELWEQLKSICDEHNSKRILVEGFVPSGERETMQVIEAGQRTAIVPHLWLAIHLKNFVPSARSELFEVIAASRGVRVKFFSDTERALRWLRNNAPA